MKKYLKPVMGGMIIVLAIALLIFWEVDGRDAVLMERVLVAKQDIYPGTVIVEEMFKEVSIPGENMIGHGLSENELKKIEGKISNQLILKNSQISDRLFSDYKDKVEEGTGIFLIKSEWIFSVSSSIRKEDVADVYTWDGKTKLGSFPVAFVKDEEGIEVKDGEIGKASKKILEREGGSATVHELEIIAPLDKYAEIIEYVFSNEGKLIILNREEEK